MEPVSWLCALLQQALRSERLAHCGDPRVGDGLVGMGESAWQIRVRTWLKGLTWVGSVQVREAGRPGGYSDGSEWQTH